MDILNEIKHLRNTVRRYPDLFKDVNAVMTLVQEADARIAEGQRVAAQQAQAVVELGRVVEATTKAREAWEQQEDALARPHDERLKAREPALVELAHLEHQIDIRRAELEQLRHELRAFAEQCGVTEEGGADATV
jgi:hypothetical protein